MTFHYTHKGWDPERKDDFPTDWMVKAIFVVALLFIVAVAGVFVWAIVQLVQHFT